MRVQDRGVAMVYQQFINYPSMSVYDNIASPMRLSGKPKEEIDRAVRDTAEMLQLTPMLDRKPLELSGGQQQRCALARALVKNAGLVLLDEPLANLDYKLREELRIEIPRIFEESGAIFVYATTEPEEALLLGGHTATLWEGRVTQFGPTPKVYRQPADATTARVFSDPPMNFLQISKTGGKLMFGEGQSLPATGKMADLPEGRYTAGFRPNHLEIEQHTDAAMRFVTRLSVTELTGSETFIHLDHAGTRWVGVIHGVHDLQPGRDLPVYLDPAHIYIFSEDGDLVSPPPTRWPPEGLTNMAKITLDNLAHSYLANPTSEDDFALKELNHDWTDGEAYALLGASGCGKTTLLNIISGLLQPSRGRILFNDVDVTHSPTTERNIAQVFQFPVVYDTMTVRENLAFPLMNRGADKAYVAQRVQEIATMIGLEDTLNRKARGLTADAKQKISLGRGMVREDVNALLFDEPLTVIDPHMKWELRTQLKQLHQQFGHTMIYVTHDQTEALTFADKVVVMHDGRVVQIGTPEDLFKTPEHTFVGYFIGSPGMNVIPAKVEGNQAYINGAELALANTYAPLKAASSLACAPNSPASPTARACPSRSAASRMWAATRSSAPIASARRSTSSPTRPKKCAPTPPASPSTPPMSTSTPTTGA